VLESALEGTRKPEEQFYLKLLNRLKLNPEEVVFLDDFGQNLKTAQKMGFHTIKVHVGVQNRMIILGSGWNKGHEQMAVTFETPGQELTFVAKYDLQNENIN